MGTLTRANLKAHWGRYTASIITIMLATAFAMGTFMFGQAFSDSFLQSIKDNYRGSVAVVTQENTHIEDSQIHDSNRIYWEKAEQFAKHPEITSVVPENGTTTKIMGDDRKFNGREINFIAQPPEAMRSFKLKEGRWIEGKNEIVLEGEDAKRYNYQLGKKIILAGKPAHNLALDHPELFKDFTGNPEKIHEEWAKKDPAKYAPQPIEATIVGIGYDRPSLRSVPGSYISPENAKEIGQSYFSFRFAASPGQEARALELARSEFGGKQVVTTESKINAQAKEISAVQKIMTLTLMIFPAIALLVSIIIVSSTFQVILAERRREMALLRCIGASKKQLRRSLVLEQTIIGISGGSLGIMLGIAISSLGLTYFELTAGISAALSAVQIWMVASILVISVLLTLFAGLGPARALGKIAPVAALTELANEGVNKKRWVWLRITMILLLIGTGVVLSYIGLQGGIKKFLFSVGGVGLTIIGVIFLIAFIAPAIIGLIGHIWPGVISTLGGQNISRNAGRTGATVASLVIATGLISMMMVGASSIKSTVTTGIDTKFGADVSVNVKDCCGIGEKLEPKKEEWLEALKPLESNPNFESAQYLYRLEIHTGKESGYLLYDLPLAKMRGGKGYEVENDTVYLSQESKLKKYVTNDKLNVTVYTTEAPGTKTFTLSVKPLRKGQHEGSVSLATMEKIGGKYSEPSLAMNFKPTLNETQKGEVLKGLEEKYPKLNIGGTYKVKRILNEAVDKLLIASVALLGVSVLVAMVGVANTLILSVASRKREFGLLRALGLEAKEAKRMVLWEALVMAILAALLGIGVGSGAAISGIYALELQKLAGEVVISIPWVGILIAISLVALASFVAAFIPARRASKYTPMQAIVS
ncbi:FtsX-like permease family protein [Actinomycetaceae bacterium TAE3-ERU4]|nr:FtsX-like permease family protein [Actinomycetaceae bacterium TAE3-ERU4]